MNRGMSLRSERGCSGWAILGWLLLVAIGAALAWYGFTSTGDDGQPVAVQPSATATAAPPSPTPLPTLSPTDTPLPTPTPQPTVAPPTATPATPNIVAGADGANVRSGPGTNYQRLGYLDPGTQARVTGRYNDWWQIDYAGAPGWVYGEIVTASNTDGVSQVEPPTAPTAVPPTATLTPTPATPTATPGPSADFRGLVPNGYSVEGAPGPFDADEEIWFNMDITNSTGGKVYYNALGTWVQETDQFQKSWKEQKFQPNQHFTWRDHIEIPNPGTYNLWMRVCFTDNVCTNLMGPVTVKVR